jgi:DNA-binding NtrC family response regulator
MGTRLSSVTNSGGPIRTGSESPQCESDSDRVQQPEKLLQNSDHLRRPNIARLVYVVGPTAINVLVSGGMKSEQQQIARIIHRLSNRRRGAFISVDCAELSADPLASELLGVGEGRRSYSSCFDLASGGTLFLNNIDGMPLLLQRKLLRVLKSRETFRGRAKRQKKIDVRLVAACRRGLLDLVERDAFDEELYHLLNIFPIFVGREARLIRP